MEVNEILKYINYNYKYGSEVMKSKILLLFDRFHLTIDDQRLINKTFDELNITIINDIKPKIELDFEWEEEDELDEILESSNFLAEIDILKTVPKYEDNLLYVEKVQKEESQEDFDNLVQANEKLIWKIAKRYQTQATVGFSLEDMTQVGMEGLIKAVEKFDLSKGYQFSTYATWWIRQAITRGIADYSTTVRLPVHMREILSRLICVENESLGEKGKIDESYITEKMGISLGKYKELQKIRNTYNVNISLDLPIGIERDDTLLSDFIVAENNENPEEQYYQLALHKEFKEVFDILTEREEKVIKLRFGFGDDGRIWTLEDIGKILNVTRERVRQIEEKALKKLRQPKNSDRLKDFL